MSDFIEVSKLCGCRTPKEELISNDMLIAVNDRLPADKGGLAQGGAPVVPPLNRSADRETEPPSDLLGTFHLDSKQTPESSSGLVRRFFGETQIFRKVCGD